MAGQNTTLSLFLVNAVHATPVLVGLFFTARAASGMVASLVTCRFGRVDGKNCALI